VLFNDQARRYRRPCVTPVLAWSHFADRVVSNTDSDRRYGESAPKHVRASDQCKAGFETRDSARSLVVLLGIHAKFTGTKVPKPRGPECLQL
jgi:hypothetical protein